MPGSYKFGHFELRASERMLLSDGRPLRLGERAFDVLRALIERRDRVVEFNELLDVVWHGLIVEENNLTVHISALRKLLGSTAITTSRGRGYRFTIPVVEVGSDSGAEVLQSMPDARAPGMPPWRKEGAVVAVRFTQPHGHLDDVAGDGQLPHPFSRELASRMLGEQMGRVLSHSNEGLCLAFEHAQGGVRSAIRAQGQAEVAGESLTLGRHRMLRVGIAAADVMEGESPGLRDAALLARTLASFAGSNEIIVTSDLATEFISGVHGDVEDLGDLSLEGGSVRAYRWRAAADGAMPVQAPETMLDGARPCIAVLPFECLLANDADDLLGEAVADDVIANLSRSPEFSVISGLSSRRLKRCGLPSIRMAGWLAATFVLTGTYRLKTGGLALDLHLQDARRGLVLRVIRLEASMPEAFNSVTPLGYRIAQEVMQTVFSHTFDQCKTMPLPGLENYSLLFGAVGLMHRATTREFDRARMMLEHLVRRQGCGGVAAAWLAKWHVLRVVQGWSADPSADVRAALEYVKRSLDDDSRDALALSIGGLVHAYLRKDLDLAGQMYQEAIDISPSEPLAWLFSATRHAYQGRGPEAEEAGERALRLSPLDPLKYFFDSLAATALLANSSWERSVALSQRSLKANRSHASTWRSLIFGLVMLDRMDEARDAVRRLRTIEPGFTVSRFRDRFPGREGPMAEPWARALKLAGLPA